jgi:outer membrane receptor protein involved in Fe transport
MGVIMSTNRSLTLTIALASLGAAPLAGAQVLEEVVVTAQKREQSLQDVGISVSAFSGDQLKALGATSTVDIAQQVPGLHLFTFSPAFTVFSLRGISQNNFQDNLEAPVAVYLDGAYIASMNAINTQLFDMERVEVLRGPQGTLFGRNATGGLIHFLTHRAEEQELNGYAEAGAAEFGTYSFEGAVGGGITDTVRGRLAGRYEKSDGYVEAGSAFGRQATGGDSNGADGYALRGTVQIDATDNVVVDLTARYSKDDHVPTGAIHRLAGGVRYQHGAGCIPRRLQPRCQRRAGRADELRPDADHRQRPQALVRREPLLRPRDDLAQCAGDRQGRRGGARLDHELVHDGQVLHRGFRRRLRLFSVQHHQRLRPVVAGAALVRRAGRVDVAGRRVLPRHGLGHVPIRGRCADPGWHQ